ncbi:MAG TPA: AmmeMemoRadiSam system protein A [Arcobacter sp.]|nr:AmmeMemoRadiSam system protein A [Arcobacter sp.]
MNDIIKKLAITAINNKLNGTKIPTKYEIVKKNPQFVLHKATFITLKQNGNLRGCIGSLVAHRELYDDIIHNAQSAAFNDPRFKPLTLEELDKTTLEISLLSDAKLVEYIDVDDLKTKITVGVDGVILKLDGKQSTFLPQVWDDLKEFDIFFEHLCKKAGLGGDCLSKKPLIYKYQVEKIN